MTSTTDCEDNKVQQHKARYSRQEKRERKARLAQGAPTQATSISISTSTSTSTPKQNKPVYPQSWQDRVFRCIRDADSTQSIYVEGQGPPPPYPFSNVSPSSFSLDSIRLVTSSTWEQSHRCAPPASGLTVRVQPLVILDLNGILCHRSRPHKEPPGVQLRPAVGSAAGTPIIVRHDLEPFLRMLDQYFCLAIWTSAKSKTARALLRLLVPEDIQRRLLFVWAQHHCEPVQLPSETLFEKHLPKVWKTYPLWNANNTLLIDDSPEKCPFAISNAIHPPPLHGQWTPPPHSNQPWIADEQNEAQQYQFFQQYIQHWHDHPFVGYLTEATVPTDNILPGQHDMTNRTLYEFLQHHGSDHMGWRPNT